MSMFNRGDDGHEDVADRTMFHKNEGESSEEETEDSNMFTRGRKQTLIEWLCAPTWTSNLDD
jgi:hypothetical protein